MDTRHPEQAIPYMKELIERYDRISDNIKKATVGPKLSELEREGALVIQEMSLVAPRMHEALMIASRTRRAALARGIVGEAKEDSPEKPAKSVEDTAEKPAKSVAKRTRKAKK